MGKRTGRRTRAGVAVLAVLGLLGQDAAAFLDTGTLLTNSASATYMAGKDGTCVTYSATSKVLVANPAVFLWKEFTPTVVATVGGFVTCTLSFSNGGANTAFNVTVNDRLPNGSGAWFYGVEGAWSGAGAPSMSYLNGGASYSAGAPAVGTRAAATYMYLRWIVPSLGVGVSGAITFVVSFG